MAWAFASSRPDLDIEAGKGTRKAADGKASRVRQASGTFAESELSPEFGPATFRLMLPLHVTAMGVIACAFGLAAITTTDPHGSEAAFFHLWAIFLVVVLCSRIALHQSEDEALAHRRGVRIWTCLVAAWVGLGVLWRYLDPDAYCAALDRKDPSIVCANVLSMLGFVVVNASHGMPFFKACSLAGIVLSDSIFKELGCGRGRTAALILGVLVVMIVITQVAQLGARKAFAHSRGSRAQHEVKLEEMMVVGHDQLSSRPTDSLPQPVGASLPPDATDPSAGPSDEAIPDATTTTEPSEVAGKPKRVVVPLFMHLSDVDLLTHPLFCLTDEQAVRRRELVLQRELELKQDATHRMHDCMTTRDLVSQDGDERALLSSSSSSSSSSALSTPTRKRREMHKVFYELRHGIPERARVYKNTAPRRRAHHGIPIRMRVAKL